MINYVETQRIRGGLALYALVTSIVVLVVLVQLVAAHAAHLQINEHHERAGIPFSLLLGICGYCTFVFATVAASSLGNDRGVVANWTRPISRERLVLSYMVVDVIGIALAFAFVLVVGALIPLAAVGLARFVRFDSSALPIGVMFFGVAVMWYAILQATSAWYRGPGGSGVVSGASWGVFVTLAVLGAEPLPAPLHAAIAAIDIVNPLAYVTSLRSEGSGSMTLTDTYSIFDLGQAWRIAIVYSLAVAAGALSIIGWKRAEL